MTRRSLFLALLVAAGGCAVFSAPALDPRIERGVAELRMKLDAHFEKLQLAAGTPAAGSQHFTGFYDSVRADVDTLRFFAGLQSGNSPTLRSLDLLVQNVDRLEAMHRQGLSAAEIPPIRTAVTTQLRMLLALERAKKRSGKEVS